MNGAANPFAAGARAVLSEVLKQRDGRVEFARRDERLLRIVLDERALEQAHGLPRAVPVATVAIGTLETGRVEAGTVDLQGAAPGFAPSLRIGIEAPERFGYAQVSAFAHHLVAAIAQRLPAAPRVAVRIPGPDFGLDALDCLEHFLLGLADAVANAAAGLTLQAIVISEPAPAIRAQYRALFDQVLTERPAGWQHEPHSWPLPCLAQAEGVAASASFEPRLRHASMLTAFVAMPFADTLDTFIYGIQQPAREAGFRAERLDLEHYTGSVTEQIRQRIQLAHVVIADLTRANPNVFLEVGFAWAKQRPTLLLWSTDPKFIGKTRKKPELPFDVRDQRFIEYQSINDLAGKLKTNLAALAPAIARTQAAGG